MALMTGAEYIESLRKLNTKVYMFGERIENWVDHPMIRPSINCVAATYDAAADAAETEALKASCKEKMPEAVRKTALWLLEHS